MHHEPSKKHEKDADQNAKARETVNQILRFVLFWAVIDAKFGKSTVTYEFLRLF